MPEITPEPDALPLPRTGHPSREDLPAPDHPDDAADAAARALTERAHRPLAEIEADAAKALDEWISLDNSDDPRVRKQSDAAQAKYKALLAERLSAITALMATKVENAPKGEAKPQTFSWDQVCRMQGRVFRNASDDTATSRLWSSPIGVLHCAIGGTVEKPLPGWENCRFVLADPITITVSND